MNNSTDTVATTKNPFGYFKPDESMLKPIADTRAAYTFLHQFLMAQPASRERSLAITKLEESSMWAIKGLVLNDPLSIQPDESGVTGS